MSDGLLAELRACFGEAMPSPEARAALATSLGERVQAGDAGEQKHRCDGQLNHAGNGLNRVHESSFGDAGPRVRPDGAQRIPARRFWC